jgi:hypothetical protein
LRAPGFAFAFAFEAGDPAAAAARDDVERRVLAGLRAAGLRPPDPDFFGCGMRLTLPIVRSRG